MKADVLELMEMKANKKLIQAKVQVLEIGKVVTLRDLSNIRSTGTNMNSLMLIINSLKQSIPFFRETKVCEKF